MGLLDKIRGAISLNTPALATGETDAWLDRFLKESEARDPIVALQETCWSNGKPILETDRPIQAAVVAAAIPRVIAADRKVKQLREKLGAYPSGKTWETAWTLRGYYFTLLVHLLRKTLPLTEEVATALVVWVAEAETPTSYWYPLSGMMRNVEAVLEGKAPGTELRSALTAMRDAALRAPYFDRNAELRKLTAEIEQLLDMAPACRIEPGEAWSDAAIADLAAMEPKARAAWHALINHCQGADAGTPTVKWSKQAKVFFAAVGRDEFKARVARWFPLVDKPRTDLEGDVAENRHGYIRPHTIINPHAEILKGLTWCCGFEEDAELARGVAALTLSAYRKVPGVGPRLVKVGNAGVHALGAMPGKHALAQLAILKVRVRFGTAQKSIEKALTATAQRLGLPREDVEEIAAPSYGLTEVGRMTEQLGDFTAVLEVTVDGGTELTWKKADGKVQRSIPAEVKASFAEELAEIRTAAKDIERMLPAQRERIDALFLQQKRWPVETWRERYLDHPLIGVIGRRLLWDFISTDGLRTTGVWLKGKMVDLDLRPIAGLDDATTQVELWHPINRSIEEVVAWRDWFDTQQIQQPFKQAHREVYLLTDAERNTRVYSNRFAAHIIRQHQFNALCGARGWKNKLRLFVDADYPPATRELLRWGLRAEFWIEGIGTEYGQDTNEAGAFLRLSTDQVRFYRIDAPQRHAHAGGGGYHRGHEDAPEATVPLEDVPPLVLSEIMRDVDLFVGVASVGNDPTWSDGGPEGRFRNYWHDYSFGELSATAKTRRAVLEKLVPRLRIAGRCELGERFLHVRGDVRTYKIHLGSGNILMLPNDQYLCIVPKQSADAKPGKVMLPFEGDNVLSVILSKAFLLAEDTKIKDPTILSQIQRR